MGLYIKLEFVSRYFRVYPRFRFNRNMEWTVEHNICTSCVTRSAPGCKACTYILLDRATGIEITFKGIFIKVYVVRKVG